MYGFVYVNLFNTNKLPSINTFLNSPFGSVWRLQDFDTSVTKSYIELLSPKILSKDKVDYLVKNLLDLITLYFLALLSTCC